MSRLNDTAVIAREMGPDALQKHESSSMSTRKISNGYVITECSSKDGKYESREYFSPTPPPDDGEGGNPMARAVSYMKGTGTL